MRAVRIGCGAGFSGDRIGPAVDLVKRGDLDFVVLECLAERTIALAYGRRIAGDGPGFDPLLERRLRPLLPALAESGTRLITNMGAADPLAAGRRVLETLRQASLDLDVAVLLGDDVLELVGLEAPAWEDGIPLGEHGEIVSANAYLGAEAVLQALATGASVVVTGRVADPSLFVAPLAGEHGWPLDDWGRIGQATLVGHLLECGPQVSGGYFADPPFKVVPDLAGLGYPIAAVRADGAASISKLPGTGGRIDALTVAEQLVYEVTDPSAYITPDVVADFSKVRVTDHGGDLVEVSGGGGRAAPGTLKVSVGYRAGFRCEAEISYAGRGAVDRARLAADVVATRLAGQITGLRLDLIGVDAVYGAAPPGFPPSECRLRACGSSQDRDTVLAIAEEITSLYTTGPAGGAGVRTRVEEVIGVVSTSIPRELVRPEVVHLGSHS